MKGYDRGLEDNPLFQALLEESARRHAHLCPRQVLGARLGLVGLRELGLVPADYSAGFTNGDKRVLTIVETDGCGADGVAIATQCEVGRRTLRIEDYGKLAATIIDTHTGRSVRVAPRPESRQLAAECAPEAESAWHAYLASYQRLPDSALLAVQIVELRESIASIISQPGLRAICARCQEEIMNERELWVDGQPLCRACAGGAYYRSE